MCGIAGLVNHDVTSEKLRSMGHAMLDTLSHRGPDNEGIWLGPDNGLLLGHRRLAIQDLSKHGAQPMFSKSGRYCVVFNGEIYNFKELTARLKGLGCDFKGQSDTEVLLEAIDKWGLTVALKSFVGMFAFAVWDNIEKELYLCRDRLGEKPLYYCMIRNCFYFASELKAIERVIDNNDLIIDKVALNSYLRYGYINAPYSIYENIFKLLPGTVLRITGKELNHKNVLNKPSIYWDIYDVAGNGLSEQYHMIEDAADDLDSCLRKTIRRQMIADVNVGAFLSGGIDSSLVSAIAQNVSSRPINTFTIGYHEKEYNESVFAEKIARHIGSNHQTVYVGPGDALDVIPLLSDIYDEPFSDSSQIPTYLVSRIAKQDVTVCLSGDGGDELFAGYNRYMWSSNLWNKISMMPGWLRRIIGKLLAIPSPGLWDKMYLLIKQNNGQQNYKLLGLKLQKLAEFFMQENIYTAYDLLLSFWGSRSELLTSEYYCDYSSRPSVAAFSSNFIEEAMYWDQISYLPGDNLTKVDRASMAVSLETRLPLLSHEIVEFSWRVPLSMKVNGNTGKIILKRVLDRYVPRNLVERPKMGFSVPVATWLRNDLKGWAEDLLFGSTLFENVFQTETIERVWKEHVEGSYDHSHQLWTLLMLMSWKARRS